MVAQTISMTASLALRIISHLWLDPFTARIQAMAEEEKLRIAKAEGMEEGQQELEQVQTQLRDTQNYMNFIQQVHSHEADLSFEHRNSAFGDTMPVWVKAGISFEDFRHCNQNQLTNINSRMVTEHLEANILNLNLALNISPWMREAFIYEHIKQLLVTRKLKAENFILLSESAIKRMTPESELYNRILQKGDEHLLIELEISQHNEEEANYYIEGGSSQATM